MSSNMEGLPVWRGWKLLLLSPTARDLISFTKRISSSSLFLHDLSTRSIVFALAKKTQKCGSPHFYLSCSSHKVDSSLQLSRILRMIWHRLPLSSSSSTRLSNPPSTIWWCLATCTGQPGGTSVSQTECLATSSATETLSADWPTWPVLGVSAVWRTHPTFSETDPHQRSCN